MEDLMDYLIKKYFEIRHEDISQKSPGELLQDFANVAREVFANNPPIRTAFLDTSFGIVLSDHTALAFHPSQAGTMVKDDSVSVTEIIKHIGLPDMAPAVTIAI